MSESWTDKYRPEKLGNVAAQGKAIKEIRKWAAKWEKGKPKKSALLFYGPPGIGKTATATALAKEMGWDLIELNASDQRTKKKIERIAGRAATMGSLTGKKEKRLIVLDEADNVHGKADRGGQSAISRLLKQNQNPVILIGNDQYEIPRGIKRKCKKINFRKLRKSSVIRILEKIAKREGIEVEDDVFKFLAKQADGDLRSAINDFQVATQGRKKVKVDDIATEERNKEIGIFEALGKLKKTRNASEAREALWDLDQTPEETIDWIDENIPKMMSNIPDLADAYEKLSRADIFLGRVRRKQNYSLWKYASDLMSAGVSLSQKGSPGKGRYSYPSYRRTYGRSKKKRKIRDNIAKKIAEECHVSKNRAINDFLPYFGKIFQKNKEKAEGIKKQLELEDEEAEYLENM